MKLPTISNSALALATILLAHASAHWSLPRNTTYTTRTIPTTSTTTLTIPTTDTIIPTSLTTALTTPTFQPGSPPNRLRPAFPGKNPHDIQTMNHPWTNSSLPGAPTRLPAAWPVSVGRVSGGRECNSTTAIVLAAAGDLAGYGSVVRLISISVTHEFIGISTTTTSHLSETRTVSETRTETRTISAVPTQTSISTTYWFTRTESRTVTLYPVKPSTNPGA